jgi:ribonuclease BN (tRNA processing enzyme)
VISISRQLGRCIYSGLIVHELGELTARAQPKLLVLYHILFWSSSPDQVLTEVREKYDGDVVLANDLDVF